MAFDAQMGELPPGQAVLTHPLIVKYSSKGIVDYVDGTGYPQFNGYDASAGDFNGDGYDDLVVGDPYSGNGMTPSSGDFRIIPGSRRGLDITKARLINMDTAGVPGTVTANTYFGGAFATGDLNGDGYADLAVGDAEASVGSLKNAGVVDVFFGSKNGLSTSGVISLSLNSTGIPDSAKQGGNFGSAVAIGNVNGDKYADLVIGAEHQPVTGTYSDSGASGEVTLVPGAASGLSTGTATAVTSGQLAYVPTDLSQGIYPVDLGETLAIADINHDGYGEVVAGAPWSIISTTAGCGAVAVLKGNKTGLSTSGRQLITENTAGIAGTAAAFDFFGSAIAVGDMSGDGHADLVVSADQKTEASKADAGAVWLIPGSSTGVVTTKSVMVNEGTAGVPGPISSAFFGYSVSMLDLNGTGVMTALVSAPNDDVTTYSDGLSASGTITAFTGAGFTETRQWTTYNFTAPDGTKFNWFAPHIAGGTSRPVLSDR